MANDPAIGHAQITDTRIGETPEWKAVGQARTAPAIAQLLDELQQLLNHATLFTQVAIL